MNAVFFNEYIQTSPKFMTDFTPWTLFVDTGIISVLLLLGKLMSDQSGKQRHPPWLSVRRTEQNHP